MPCGLIVERKCSLMMPDESSSARKRAREPACRVSHREPAVRQSSLSQSQPRKCAGRRPSDSYLLVPRDVAPLSKVAPRPHTEEPTKSTPRSSQLAQATN